VKLDEGRIEFCSDAAGAPQSVEDHLA
jgi:hypothetical protein